MSTTTGRQGCSDIVGRPGNQPLPSVGRPGARPWRVVLCALALGLAAFTWGCGENRPNGESDKRVMFSSGEFNRGYKDGQRDAKWSLTDISGGWMWLWLMEKEYQHGYEQGWQDGREAAKLEEKRKRQEGESRNFRRAEHSSSG